MRKFPQFQFPVFCFPGKTAIALLFLTISVFKTTSVISQSPAGLITNITGSTGHSYTFGGLVEGGAIYSDRAYVATNVPAFLNNAPLIKTPNDDKANKSATSPSFTLTQNATVYVAYDPRATVLPSWLNGWQKLAIVVGINDPNISSLSVYSKAFPAGNVTLGGNLASPAAGALNMYIIMALPQTEFTLSVSTSGSGTVTKNPNQATYASGTSVSLNATPASGQQFTGWSGAASGTANPLTVVMDANKSITATFAPISGALITNITPATANSYILGTLAVGSTVYSDRAYQVTGVPAFLVDAPFIKTPNDDKGSKLSSILSFTLTKSATVYVMYDPRATALPSWLSTWQKSASVVNINDPKVGGFPVYSKSFPAGKVTLGGNLANPAAGALTNYFVAALPQSGGFSLTIHTSGNGTVDKNPDQAAYAAGTSVTLTATPGSGQQFSGWSGDAGGATNPLSIIMDADKTITASFSPTSGGPLIAVTPLKIYDNEVSGGAAGIARTITVTNNGAGALSLSSINNTGANTNQFALSGLPSFPATIASGGTISFSITFNPTSTGLKTVTVNINSNDQANPAIAIPVRGLGTVGLGGNNEPSLQSLLNLLEIQANVGDDDIATTVINSNTTTQKAALLGDEISLQQFQKAGAGNVTITPLGIFGPTANNPIIGLGWYKSGDATTRSELLTVSNSPVSNGQTVNVNYNGELSFDPASGSFGFFCRWPFFNNRLMYSEDNLNTFSGAVPHHVRVFPYKKNGIIIPNSYIVTFEDNTTSLDYNDVIFLVSNVKKFSTQTSTSNALLFVENPDAFPSNEHVVFSHIQVPWTRDSIYNANHDSIKIRLHNYGINPLTVSDLNISNNTLWKVIKLGAADYDPLTQLPATINAGGILDVTVKFIANNLGTSATRIKMVHETLTITSNDDINPNKQIFLDGLWQYSGEGTHEPYSHEIFEAFGYTTKTGYQHSDPDKGDTTKLKGDEIKPSYFLRADSTFPVTVRQLSAYHGCCQQKEHFKWFEKGTSVFNDLFLHIGPDGQTLLPRRSLNGNPSAGTFIPAKLPFGFQVGEGNTTDPSRNSVKLLGVRVYKALDAAGNIIPNAYLFSGDYLGTNVTNYDYNDNSYYVSNIKPYIGTVFYSTLNVNPSDLDFGEQVLQTKDSILLNISSAGKAYPNGSQDPPLEITSVVISGENQSDFSADMPLIASLNPQQATTLKVRFNPKSQGLKIADLLIYYKSAKSPKRVPLYGIGKGNGVTVTANFRINSGASSATTFEGKTWAADNTYAHDNLEPYKNSAVKQITATDEDFLYLDEQSSNGEKKPFRYQFPVSNGTYYVRLHFAEIYWGSPGLGLLGGVGNRFFSVKMENQYRLANYDLTADVGPATAVIKNFMVTVTDGQLNIDFSATLNRPLVSAIEVYSFSAPAATIATVQNRGTIAAANEFNATSYDFKKPRIYPNPVFNKTVNIQFPANYQGVYAMQLVDMVGRKYDLGKTNLYAGVFNKEVDISRFSLKQGVYFLRISANNNKTDLLKLLIK